MPREPRTRLVFIAVGAFALFLGGMPAGADDNIKNITPRIGGGDPVTGKQKLQSLLCQECHGEDGISISTFAPNLAGQYADYIVKQVREFQTGERDNPTMNMIAPTIDDATLLDVAAFFASNEKMKGDGGGSSGIAKDLFENGDARRGLLPCMACHGADGNGTASGGDVYPMVAGQRLTYLRDQLYHWKSGERSNSPSGIMNKIAETLSDVEIDALAKYISGL
jgi:cytochrome c553